MVPSSTIENAKLKRKEQMISLLDLPKLILESILERLSPADLRNMTRVCSSLREMCSSDHLWEKHLQKKWGKVIGDAAYREWQCNIGSKIGSKVPEQKKEKGLFEYHPSPWRFSWNMIKPEKSAKMMKGTTLPLDSVMDFCLALESGNFWFPAQVYYKQNGYYGVMLLCYSSQLSYVSQTNTFRARLVLWPNWSLGAM